MSEMSPTPNEGSALRAFAPAKLNLTLRVGPRRTDGYHEIESLIVPLALGDALRFEPRAADGVAIECDDASIPCDASNLVARAADALAGAAGVRCGVRVIIEKRIPAGAGLGGGSSDAAATLRALNELWGLRRSVDELAQLGAAIGSDVPALVYARPCIVSGRGERVHLDVPPIDATVLLVLPEVHSATPSVYAAFDGLPPPPRRTSLRDLLLHVAAGHSDPGATRLFAGGAAAAAISGESLLPRLYNDLSPAAQLVNPVLERIAEELHRETGRVFHMSGSGAALYSLFDRTADGDAAAGEAVQRISRARWRLRVELTHIIHSVA